MANEKKEATKSDAPIAASSPAPDYSAAVKEAIKEALPLAVGLAAQAAQPAAKPYQSGQFSREKCAACRQYLIACKGEHEMLAVYPQNSKYGRWFQGVWINGERYLSNNLGHKIAVPKANDIRNIISTWEAAEEVLQNGRSAVHDSGSIGGPNSGGFVPANAAWR